MADETFCQPPLSIIRSSGSPCSNRLSSAPSLNEWSLSGCSLESIFKYFFIAFNMVLILDGCRLLPILPCLCNPPNNYQVPKVGFSRNICSRRFCMKILRQPNHWHTQAVIPPFLTDVKNRGITKRKDLIAAQCS
jgi:hypothetical protein